jgi:hypothetical protein
MDQFFGGKKKNEEKNPHYVDAVDVGYRNQRLL